MIIKTPKLTYNEERRWRTSFRASDFGKSAIDIKLELQKVEPTNPKQWFETLRMAAGKGVELAMVEVLKQNKVVDQEADQEKQEKTVIEREGVTISMLFDAVGVKAGGKISGQGLNLPNDIEVEIGEGEPIEIKSINNKNSFDIQDYNDGKPRESYVGQLAIYMDALGKKRGHLFCSTIDGLYTFWFVCEDIGDGKYKCGETIVDVKEEYKRFAKIWAEKDTEPDWFECGRYKVPVSEIDWTKVSTSKISDVRNGRKIIGDEGQWKILYSNYQDLIISKQGITERRYSEEELEQIKAATAGYSAKKK